MPCGRKAAKFVPRRSRRRPSPLQPALPRQGARAQGLRAASALQTRPRPRSGRGRRSSPRSGLPASGKARLQPAAPGPPSDLLPAGRGSLPCRRRESRRSAKRPWRRAIRGRVGLRAVPRHPPPTALSAPPLSTWDVALAAAGEPGRTARREIVSAAAGAAAPPPTAPPAPSPRNCLSVRRWGGRAGGGERGGASACSRERGNAVPPAWEAGYGTPDGTRFISRKILARKHGCWAAAPRVAETGGRLLGRIGANAYCFPAIPCLVPGWAEEGDSGSP